MSKLTFWMALTLLASAKTPKAQSVTSGGITLDSAKYPPAEAVPTFLKPEWENFVNAVVPDSNTGADILGCPNPGDWGLTFDDGPHPQYTPLNLDFLKENNVKATMFVMGSMVLQNPQILRRAYEEGHHIAIHTWSHPSLPALPASSIIAELMWTAEIIKDVIGVTPIYFRPPYGETNNLVRGVAKVLGFKQVIWNYDSNDWRIGNGYTITQVNSELITQLNKNKTGIISLQHDINSNDIAAAKSIIPQLVKSGYNVMSIASCLHSPSYSESNHISNNNNIKTPPTNTTTFTTATTSNPAAASSVFNGALCKTFGAWDCGNQCQCGFGCGNTLCWICTPSSMSCGSVVGSSSSTTTYGGIIPTSTTKAKGSNMDASMAYRFKQCIFTFIVVFSWCFFFL